MIRPFVVLAPFALAGCLSSADISTRNTPTDYGATISQAECQAKARRHVDPTLLRPTSAKYKFGRCLPDTLGAKPLLGLPRQSGYAMAFAVDAQNAWGSYTGFRNYEILFYNGGVVRRVRTSLETGVWEAF